MTETNYAHLPPSMRPETLTDGWLCLRGDGLLGAGDGIADATADATERYRRLGAELPSENAIMTRPANHAEMAEAQRLLDYGPYPSLLTRERQLTGQDGRENIFEFQTGCECGECGATGRSTGPSECSTCDGTGTIEVGDDEVTEPCLECHGIGETTGETECPDCGGTGWTTKSVEATDENDIRLAVAVTWQPGERPQNLASHGPDHGQPMYPMCPDCRTGELEWAQADHVPGTRQCRRCKALFSDSAYGVTAAEKLPEQTTSRL